VLADWRVSKNLTHRTADASMSMCTLCLDAGVDVAERGPAGNLVARAAKTAAVRVGSAGKSRRLANEEECSDGCRNGEE
jgi:hypothetical protein